MLGELVSVTGETASEAVGGSDKVDDEGVEDATDWGGGPVAMVAVDNEPEVGPTPSYKVEDGAGIAPLVGSLVKAGDGTLTLEGELCVATSDAVDEVGRTVVVKTTDVSVDAGAVVAVPADNVNCLENDVVEPLDRATKSNGGSPGVFPTAGTEPLCLPIVLFVDPTGFAPLDADIMGTEGTAVPVLVRTNCAEGIKEDCVEGAFATLNGGVELKDVGINVEGVIEGLSVATPLPTRLVTVVSGLEEDNVDNRTAMILLAVEDAAAAASRLLSALEMVGSGAIEPP